MSDKFIVLHKVHGVEDWKLLFEGDVTWVQQQLDRHGCQERSHFRIVNAKEFQITVSVERHEPVFYVSKP